MENYTPRDGTGLESLEGEGAGQGAGEEGWLGGGGGAAPAVRSHHGGVEPSHSTVLGSESRPRDGPPQHVGREECWLSGRSGRELCPLEEGLPAHHVWGQGREPDLGRGLVRERRPRGPWKAVSVRNRQSPVVRTETLDRSWQGQEQELGNGDQLKGQTDGMEVKAQNQGRCRFFYI